MLDLLLELLYPNRCIFCDRILPWGRGCKDCEEQIDSLRCKRNTCFSVENSAAPFIYKDKARDSMLRFKYGRHVEYKFGFAEEMAKVLPEQNFDCIIAIPPYRHYKGVTDTTRSLGKELAKRTGIPFRPKYLIKVRATLLQHKLNYKQRQQNLLDCFETDEADISGKSILLVDDIITTGATMREASKTLFEAGAKRVFCIAACYTEEKILYYDTDEDNTADNELNNSIYQD